MYKLSIWPYNALESSPVSGVCIALQPTKAMLLQCVTAGCIVHAAVGKECRGVVGGGGKGTSDEVTVYCLCSTTVGLLHLKYRRPNVH